MRCPPLLLSALLLAACSGRSAEHTTTSGAGGATGTGSHEGGGGTATTSTSPPLVAAKGVTISQIALYQGPKRALFGGEPAAITVPIVAGRAALVRVFVAPGPDYDGAPVTARLHLSSAPAPLEVTATVTAGAEADLASTLDFDVPGALLVPDIAYRVELLQPPSAGATDNPGARYPATGDAPLDVVSDGPTFELVIVPVQYDADGSHRMPDTSPQKIQAYADAFLGTYPIRDISISVHAPFPYSGTVWEFGLGWGALQSAIEQLREDEGAPASVYYYGIFAPADTFDDYCIGSCTTGLGTIGTVSDPSTHAAIGLGFAGEDWVGTAIHEIGHAHGRTHAPCGGAGGVDPGFPYAGAGIGVWGYDIVKKELVSPDVGKDMMGYCDPYWISDYTYAGIFERMKVVSQAHRAPHTAAVWARARVEMDGSIVPLSPVALEVPPSGQAVPITLEGAGGVAVIEGRLLPYDHLPGGVLLWPKPTSPVSAATATIDGQATSIPL